MAEQEEKKITKPWCVYGRGILFPHRGYGKIKKEHQTAVEIFHTEKQDRPSALWDSQYMKRFDTLLEALKEFYQNQKARREGALSWKKLKEQARENFPSENLEENAT